MHPHVILFLHKYEFLTFFSIASSIIHFFLLFVLKKIYFFDFFATFIFTFFYIQIIFFHYLLNFLKFSKKNIYLNFSKIISILYICLNNKKTIPNNKDSHHRKYYKISLKYTKIHKNTYINN
ncbi:hypothetical protein TPHSE_11220 [Terrisporobacter petrolearius]